MSKSLVSNIKDYFGLKPGQKLQGLSAELRELGPQDRLDLATAFNRAGTLTGEKWEKERELASEEGITKAGPGY